jgi:glutaminyl-tRNA synthetase
VTCTRVLKDPASGEVTELHCTYDPASRGGWTSDGRKVLGTLHWVSAAHSLPAEVRLYNPLFSVENPGEEADGADYKTRLAPDSLEVLDGARVEESLRGAAPLARFQFLRQGYFCVDYDSKAERPVFNRTVTLRDTWAKIEKSLK